MKRPAKSFKAIFAASFFLLAMMGIVGPAYGAPQTNFVYATGYSSTGSGTVLRLLRRQYNRGFESGPRLTPGSWFGAWCAGPGPFK